MYTVDISRVRSSDNRHHTCYFHAGQSFIRLSINRKSFSYKRDLYICANHLPFVPDVSPGFFTVTSVGDKQLQLIDTKKSVLRFPNLFSSNFRWNCCDRPFEFWNMASKFDVSFTDLLRTNNCSYRFSVTSNCYQEKLANLIFFFM